MVRSQAFREATKKCSPRLLAQLEAVLGALEFLPFETPADATYGLLRARGLSKLAHESAPMICSSRLKHLLLVTRFVTHNQKEFVHVEDLRRENGPR